MAAKVKKILTTSILVRDPKTDAPVFLEAGTPVPHGYGKLISDDHFALGGAEVMKETAVVETDVVEVVESVATEVADIDADELAPDNTFDTE